MEKLIPTLRFPEFEGEWDKKKLGKILTIGSGRDYKHLGDGDIPVFGTGGLMTSVDDFLYDGETVCIGRKGTIDKPMFYNGKIWTVDTLFYTHTFVGSKPKFVYNLFQRVNWKQHNEAGGVPSLSKSTIEQIQLFLPSLPEQTKIAIFFTAVDDKLTQLKKKKTLLEQYKKGVMQQIFSQQLRFKQDDGSDFEEWEEKKLGEIANIRSGLSKDQNGNTEGYRVTRIETISDGTINLEKIGYIDLVDKIEDYKLIKGDILFSNINSVSHIGKTAIAYNNLDIYHGMNLLCLKCSESINPFFLFYYLNTTELRNYFKTICNQAVSQASINQTELAKTELSIPSLPEQTKIANFLSAIDDKINQCGQQVEKMETWKKGLLQRMFV